QVSDGTNTGTVQYEDSNDLIRGWAGWQEWNIELEEFVDDNGVDLSAVTKLGIKIGDGTMADLGEVYFDDIRLYPSRCVPAYSYRTGSFRYIDRYAASGSFESDCFVDYFDLYSLSSDWLVEGLGTVTATSAPSGDDLIGHWTMDDDLSSGTEKSVVLDISGNDNDGLLYDDVSGGTPALGLTGAHSVPGVNDLALEFDGFDDYVEIPALGLNSNTLTVSAWVLPYRVQEMYSGIVSCNEPNSLSFCFGSNAEYADPTWTGNNELCYYWTGWSWDFHSGLIVPDGLWSFVGLTVEPGKGTLYLYDGLSMLVSTNYESHVPQAFAEVSYFGGKDGQFEGAMDDVYIYDRVLSPEEMLYVALREPGSQYMPLEPWRADANKDDMVNFPDFAVIADNWLTEVLWP
ncbi:MAG: LamG domain-containing protein, partial [Sedimentisphaerales bacterium]|nr:LamG domain-containing protein [Sedimentisphaerales bacterium]